MTTANTAAARPQENAGVETTEIRNLIVDVLPAFNAISTGGEMLGGYTAAWRWLAGAQGVAKPTLNHPRIALFAAASADKLQTTVDDIAKGHHPVARIAADANTDLQVYELTSEGDGPLSAAEAAHAFSYGLMAVQPGIDLLVIAALNPQSEAAAEVLLAALKKHEEPLEALAAAGGLDLCAMAGAIAAARLAKIPVLLDGKAAFAAAEALKALRPDAAKHCLEAASLLLQPGTELPGLNGALLVPLLKAIAVSA